MNIIVLLLLLIYVADNGGIGYLHLLCVSVSISVLYHFVSSCTICAHLSWGGGILWSVLSNFYSMLIIMLPMTPMGHMGLGAWFRLSLILTLATASHACQV